MRSKPGLGSRLRHGRAHEQIRLVAEERTKQHALPPGLLRCKRIQKALSITGTANKLEQIAKFVGGQNPVRFWHGRDPIVGFIPLQNHR